MINLSSLEIVDENSRNIFLNCNSLETLCLSSQPPNKFNKDIIFDKVTIILPKSTQTNVFNFRIFFYFSPSLYPKIDLNIMSAKI